MAQDKNLPEGTDKIIPGASGTTVEEVVVVEAVAIEPANPASTGGTQGGSSGGTGMASQDQTGTSQGSGSTRQMVKDKMRSGKDKLSQQSADKARGLVSQGLERGGGALANVSKLVNDTADGLDERLGPEYGDYARRAAQAIDSTAERLRNKDPDELIDDTREFVRKSPGVALAGAAIVGFVLARLVKSGLDASSNAGRRDTASSRQEGRDSGTV